MRGAFVARFETLVCARSADSVWPPALKPVESTLLFGQFSWPRLIR